MCQILSSCFNVTGVLEEHKMEHDAEYLAVLADKMALVPSRGGALFQNIQSGGRQSLTHLSKPSMRSTLKASQCHCCQCL